jgi:calcineurin-like phosphoesterase family protein
MCHMRHRCTAAYSQGTEVSTSYRVILTVAYMLLHAHHHLTPGLASRQMPLEVGVDLELVPVNQMNIASDSNMSQGTCRR